MSPQTNEALHIPKICEVVSFFIARLGFKEGRISHKLGHPLASFLFRYSPTPNFDSIPGHGVEATVGGSRVLIGNRNSTVTVTLNALMISRMRLSKLQPDAKET